MTTIISLTDVIKLFEKYVCATINISLFAEYARFTTLGCFTIFTALLTHSSWRVVVLRSRQITTDFFSRANCLQLGGARDNVVQMEYQG